MPQNFCKITSLDLSYVVQLSTECRSIWPKPKVFTIWTSASVAKVLFEIFGLCFFLKKYLVQSLKEDKTI